jgi:ubiquinone/menaquinone biosynthesis C-methylase UbiE
MIEGWQWDESLFLGSARYYVRGRPPYSAELANTFRELFALDGRGRLIDAGCGPGILALALAPLFEEVIGVDPDPEMLAEAKRGAEELRITNAHWVQARIEELPADFGPFRIATFGRSFHWMDQPRVAAMMSAMLEPAGAFVIVNSGSHDSPGAATELPFPVPPLEAIRELVQEYLGPVRRAGQGMIEHGTKYDLAGVLSTAGFVQPESIRVPVEGALIRTTDDLVAFVFSRSGSAPHLFGDRLSEFEADLRQLLDRASPSGKFAEQPSDTQLEIWRTPQRKVAGR